MKKSKDPFEIAFEDQEESPPGSPVGVDENETQTSAGTVMFVGEDTDTSADVLPTDPSIPTSLGTAGSIGKNKEDDDDEEENMDVELGKLQASGDPAKMAKMQEILAHFTREQMSSLLTSITGSAKISDPMTIVMSGMAKMFVGELVETARLVMAEREDTGPIRPCHIREAYRRLKLEGKIPKRSVCRLFR
ncbi:transcription initiation factor TFIID subunit 11 [Orobanche gracilis]